jgi:hypothetical protein
MGDYLLSSVDLGRFVSIRHQRVAGVNSQRVGDLLKLGHFWHGGVALYLFGFYRIGFQF